MRSSEALKGAAHPLILEETVMESGWNNQDLANRTDWTGTDQNPGEVQTTSKIVVAFTKSQRSSDVVNRGG